MKKCCSSPLFQSLLSINIAKGLPAVSKRLSLILQFIQNFFLPLDDLLSRPRRNFFRIVSSFPSALWNICRNKSTQLISTACSVLKLLLSHSGHHGPVVSYWFSESLITFPNNGCHYLFGISLQLGIHISQFLPATVNAVLAVALHSTVKAVTASIAYSSRSCKI